MNNKQKLELTWIGKGEEPKLEPRILLYDEEKSYGDQKTENMLIHGDNLLALKALEQDYAGKVKCIYIDPPYNTGSAFAHYDDNLEHSIWLNLMKSRMDLLRNLLSDDGSIWISIDDDEQAYLKILCDEAFGRKNYITTNVWQKRTSPDMRATISDGHEYILVYGKDKLKFKNSINRLLLNEDQKKAFKNPDNDPNGPWTSSDFTAQGYRPNQMYKIVTPAGVEYTPPEGRCWKNIEAVYLGQLTQGRMWFGKDGKGIPRRKTYLNERQGVTPWTWWTNKEVGHNQEAKKEIITLFGANNVFDTPKPERLLERIITLSTNEGDLVLDSFLGSGTTAAIAHKMKRRWIGIELGDHCFTHCKPRLEKVIEGEQGGISKAVNWEGGGGFKFYELAPSLLKQDKYGNWVIDKEQYNVDMLAAAVAKLNGYQYSPDETVFWKQGKGHESSYIFTTTQFVSANYLDMLTAEMQQGENLLICCSAYDEGLNNRYENITIKKIPQAVLDKCEFGARDYNINIGDTRIKESEDMSDE